MTHHFKDIIAAPFTPMDDKGRLALQQVAPMAQLLERNGVAGAFIGGTTGEGLALHLEERVELLREWMRVRSANTKIIVMLGSNALGDIRTLAEEANALGADAVALLPPTYYSPADEDSLVDFCAAAVDDFSNLPFYYYHIPALSGVSFPMRSFIDRIADRIPHFAGIKFSFQNLMDFHACVRHPRKVTMLWGSDETLLSALVVGAHGAVGSTYNYAAPLYHKMLQAWRDGDLETAEAWQSKSVALVDLMVKYGGLGVGKAFMKIIGLDCGIFRLPVRNLNDHELKSLESELKSIGFFDFCCR